MCNVVARQEFSNFRVNIFFPFIGDKQTRAAVVWKNVTAQGIDDACMCFVRTCYDDNKTMVQIATLPAAERGMSTRSKCSLSPKILATGLMGFKGARVFGLAVLTLAQMSQEAM